jgi:hypothetical protein
MDVLNGCRKTLSITRLFGDSPQKIDRYRRSSNNSSLLNDVHWLMRIIITVYFKRIARKILRTQANLLGGRALRLNFIRVSTEFLILTSSASTWLIASHYFQKILKTNIGILAEFAG